MMGVLTAGGAVARTIGPLWSAAVFSRTGNRADIVFLAVNVVLVISLITLSVLSATKIIQKRIAFVSEMLKDADTINN